MPRQHELPHTAGARGPCDNALEAWQDACESAEEATAERRRKRDELVDAIQECGASRIPYVDRKTKRRKWLEVTAGEPKLRSVKAEAGAGVAETGHGVPAESADADPATAGRRIAPGAAGELVDVASDDSSDSTGDNDLRTPGQQRRRVRR